MSYTTAATRHGTPDILRELAARAIDTLGDTIIDGGLHGTAVSTSATLSHCRAYINGYYTEETAAKVITYSGGDGTYWLAMASHRGITPGSWTRIPGSPYLWIKASTQPTPLSNTMLIGRITVSGGAITAFASMGNRIVTTPVTISENMTVLTGYTWQVNALITVASGKTLTHAGMVVAAPVHIFNADSGTTGDIVFSNPAMRVHPEWWGCDNTGTTNHATAMFNLALAALPNGGTILGAGPWAIYHFNGATADITQHNITIDGQSCTFIAATTSSYFVVNGDSGTDGDRSDAVKGFRYCNVYHGTANDSSNKFAGPRIQWADDPIVENVHIKGQQSGIDIHYCERPRVRNVSMRGFRDSSIGFLSLHSNDAVYQDLYFADGAPVYVLQIKGGHSCVIQNATARNIAPVGGFSTAPEVAFRSRGDAPWGASGTTGTYPYATGDWDNPDTERANQHCRWINCAVFDSPSIKAFEEEESFDGQWSNITGVNVGRGITFTKNEDGEERDYILNDFHFEECGTSAGATSTGIAVSASGLGGEFLEGLIIRNGVVRGCEAEGITLLSCREPTVDACHVFNAGQGGLSNRNRGIELTTCIRPRLTNCAATDDQGSPTQDIGIYVDSDCAFPTIHNCVARGNITEQIRSWVVGSYVGNTPGEATATTTSATNVDDRLRLTLEVNDRVLVEVIAIGREIDGAGNHGVYGIRGLVYLDSSGDAQIQGSASDIFTAIESDATWVGLSFGTFGAGATFRVRVGGKASTTINWTLHVTCRRVS